MFQIQLLYFATMLPQFILKKQPINKIRIDKIIAGRHVKEVTFNEYFYRL